MPHPTRPCRCAVGRHASAADIDAALVNGGKENSVLALEARYPPLSKSGIGRHRKECLGLGRDSGTASRDGPASQRPTTAASHEEAASQVSSSQVASERPAASDQPPRKRRIGEPPPGCPTKEARVNIIIGLMARLEWVTGVTGGELAELWGIHPGTVEHDACEASRAVQRQVDPGAVQALVMAALHEALGLGLDFARTKVIDGRTREGDPKALNSVALIAKSMAVFAPAPAPQRPGLTPEQRPQLNVIYPNGVGPAATLPSPLQDGPPLQPAPSPGAPGARPWP
jgi:hypothetical protein